MKNESGQSLGEFFDKQLERTNYWLSFAEAKNAALVAFNIAAIAFIAEFLKDLPCFSTVIMIVFIASSLVCLRSFLPNDTSRPKSGPKFLPTDNLLFWKDIAYSENEEKYMEHVISRYFPSAVVDDTEKQLYTDFCSEIVINSRIAMSKYNLFTLALRIDCLGFLLSVVLLILA